MFIEHIDSDYNQYTYYVKQICDSGNISNFKQERIYADILEHVSKEQGQQYLDCIFSKTPFSISDVWDYCYKNDSVGNPHKSEYQFGENLYHSVSPTSLRYVYQSHLILSHIQELDIPAEKLNIVEVGGGYGGLCLALYMFAPYYDIRINSYTIVDLTQVIRLQALYHSAVGLSNIDYVDASTYGKDIDKNKMFFISNYCFSEISLENQHWYRYHLLPKVSHGFMCWNNRTPCEGSIPFVFQSFRENPNTGEYNKFIYF